MSRRLLLAVALLGCGGRERGPVRGVGTLELTEVDVAPTTPARVLGVYVDEGAEVRAGDTIAVLAQPTTRAEIEQARARVAAAEARLLELRAGRTARVQVIVDAADPMASSAAMSAALLAASARAAELAPATEPAGPRLEVRVRPWYNPGLRSAVYSVPGIVGVLLSMTMVMIASMAVVRERERGTLEQLVVTPIGRGALMLGKLVPFVLIGYVQMTVILLLGRLLFEVPAWGSLSLLSLLTLAFIVANLGLGLLVSTAVRTQTQAMQLGFFFLLPNILLSGFMFPRQAMPEPAQWLGAFLPLTYYLRILRGILLKGVGAAELLPEALALAGFAIAAVALSARRFSKTVE